MELLGVAMVSAGNEVLTIGHSSLNYERFVELLRKAGVTPSRMCAPRPIRATTRNSIAKT